MDTEWDHYSRLTRLSNPGCSLSRTADRTSIKNSDWFTFQESTDIRGGLHEQIAASVRHQTTVSPHPLAILLSGPPGAGKSSALNDITEQFGADRRCRVIDPDAFKDALLHQSLRDGSYHKWLMPDEVWHLHTNGERFHPRELATLVHAESAMIAKLLTNRAIVDRADFVLDGTLNDKATATQLLGRLRQAGYQTTIVNVDCSRAQSLERCYTRWLAGRQAAVAAEADERLGWDDRLGGRFVPPQFTRSLFDPANPTTGTPLMVAKALFNEQSTHRLVTYRLHPGEQQPVHDQTHFWKGDRAHTENGQRAAESLRDNQFKQPKSFPTRGYRPPGRPGPDGLGR